MNGLALINLEILQNLNPNNAAWYLVFPAKSRRTSWILPYLETVPETCYF